MNPKTIITDTSKKVVVVFSKEKCKYCTMSKKLFNEYNIPYKEVKLDPSDDKYQDVRKELINISNGHSTFPWIFTGDNFLGGFTDLDRSVTTGSIVSELKRIGIDYDYKIDDDF